MKKILIGLFGLMIVAGAFAQQPKVDVAGQSNVAAKTDVAAKFELADVHASGTTAGFVQTFGGVLREGKYVNRDVTLVNLIATAYGVPEDNVVGGPGWISSDMFDVVAKVPEGTKMATANLMLKSLLIERFGLVTHEGTYPLPRYVLSVGKGGSKLKPAAGSDDATCVPKQVTFPTDPNDLANFPDIQVSCHNLTAEAIGQNLRRMAGGYVDHDVVDMTHLEGSFDFDLTWTARNVLPAKGRDGISVFDAVDKQLGLKLELKDVPVPGLVVDHVNRNPTANPAGAATALALAAARFEVASIKPADPSKPSLGAFLLYTGGSQMTAGGTLRQMISLALQVPQNVANDMVVGLPKSADTQAWMIEAKIPSTGEGAAQMVNGQPTPPPLSVGLEMLRGELVSQFELKTHMEDREVTVYALTLAKAKPTFAQANDSERSECKPDPNATKPFAGITGPMTVCKNTTMAQLAQTLQQRAGAYMDHPVVDATGLTGGWDFVMGWTPRQILEAPQKPDVGASAAGVPGDPNGGISVFDAMEKELGLKLVKQKKTIQVIVVDHVDEKPVQQ